MTVFVPPVLSVDEGGGRVQVCAKLLTIEVIERRFTVTLSTSDGTGNTLDVSWQEITSPSF